MFELSKRRFHNYFKKDIRIFFIFASAFYFSGFLLDSLFNYDKYGESMLLINLVEMIIIATAFYLGVKNRISIQKAYVVIIFSVIISLAVLYGYMLATGKFKPFILFQDMLAIPLTIVSAGLIISKRYLLTVGIIFSVLYPSIMFLSGEPHLQDSALFVFILILGPTFALFYIINSVEKTLDEHEQMRKNIQKQKEELKKLNEEKDKLFSLISHDLRGPIGNTKNMISFALDSYLSDAEKDEILKAAVTSLDKTYTLLTSLLDWSTNELGVLKYSPQNVELHSLVNDTVTFLESSIRDKNIKVVNSITPDLLTFSDKTLLASIFRNLLSNAIKFSNRNGKIQISTDYYKNQILVIVKDEGLGIPEEKLQTLFDDHLGKTTLGTEHEKGYGFGLNLVKEFVERNGGSIWAESKVGHGTTFYFTLPLSDVNR